MKARKIVKEIISEILRWFLALALTIILLAFILIINSFI